MAVHLRAIFAPGIRVVGCIPSLWKGHGRQGMQHLIVLSYVLAGTNVSSADRLLRQCGLAVDEAFAIAIKNIESVAQISPIRTVLEELLGEELPDGGNEPKMIIVSNEQRCNGAPLMFSKEIQGELLEIFEKRAVYVLPSSIHEFIAVSASYMSIDDLREMVRTINENEVDPEERLTDEVYTLIGTPENPVFGMSSCLGAQGQETFLTARF